MATELQPVDECVFLKKKKTNGKWNVEALFFFWAKASNLKNISHLEIIGFFFLEDRI